MVRVDWRLIVNLAILLAIPLASLIILAFSSEYVEDIGLGVVVDYVTTSLSR